MSWIHIDDLCALFIYAMDHPEMNGVYNAVAPTVTTNQELTRAIAARLRRRILLPPVPAFVLRGLLGEMADLVVKGSKVSAQRVLQSGFQFRFGRLGEALDDLLS
ncbi:MAG: DUF1731 domain-containing protein [Cyclobacteriaceae bacterium]|nr:DUF1731 domain-containing protein [Cyclobacteriaceae bacterium]